MAVFFQLLGAVLLPEIFRMPIARFSRYIRAFLSSMALLPSEGMPGLFQPAAEEYDFFPAQCGQLIGPGQRYKILGLLGAGQRSTVLLAEDLLYVVVPSISYCNTGLISKVVIRSGRGLHAVKILNLRSTAENRSGALHELATLQAIRLEHERTIRQLPVLSDHFEVSGPRGDHLCLVCHAKSTTLDSFRRSVPSNTLRPHLVQLVASQTTELLWELHEAHIVHAGEIRLPITSLKSETMSD